jgi:hypothetical protein
MGPWNLRNKNKGGLQNHSVNDIKKSPPLAEIKSQFSRCLALASFTTLTELPSYAYNQHHMKCNGENVPLFKNHNTEDTGGHGVNAPCILNLDGRWILNSTSIPNPSCPLQSLSYDHNGH